MLSHEHAMRQLAKTLSITSERGIVYTPNVELGIQCYVDTDFAGRWSKVNANSPETVMSRTGSVIMYTGFPVLWQSKRENIII
eukprot:14660468-Ditylum_brightwellii.AAC.1